MIYESMTKLVCEDGVIRVWRTETSLETTYPNEDLRREFEGCVECGWHPVKIVERLACLYRVSAVEWVDSKGQGVVIYVEWP